LQFASPFFHPISYADDTTLFVTIAASELFNMSNNINSELNNINIWLKLNKLSLNASKTKAMVFHTPQKQITQLPNLCIDGQEIEFLDTFNFLV